MGFIYQVLNLVSNKCYIGQSRQKVPASRWCQHRHQAFVKQSKSSALYDAMRSYGLDAFQFNIIATVDDDALNQAEADAIKTYNSMVPNGYNIKAGGDHVPHAEETKRKIGEKSKGRRTNNGRNFSAEWRRNIGNASRGRKFSQPVKDHLSQVHNEWHDNHPIPHKNCKYTEADIRFMRSNPENLTEDQLRERFNIERYRLRQIQARKLYSRVKD
jgi:group I intron endonuclease